jgi:hypothetical protein
LFANGAVDSVCSLFAIKATDSRGPWFNIGRPFLPADYSMSGPESVSDCDSMPERLRLSDGSSMRHFAIVSADYSMSGSTRRRKAKNASYQTSWNLAAIEVEIA